MGFVVGHCLILVSVQRSPVFTVSWHRLAIKLVGMLVTFLLLKTNKPPWAKQLIKEFIWVYGSKWLEFLMAEPSQQPAGMAAGAQPQKQRKQTRKWFKTLKISQPASRDIPSPARPHLLNLPKEQHCLRTKYLVSAIQKNLVQTTTVGACQIKSKYTGKHMAGPSLFPKWGFLYYTLVGHFCHWHLETVIFLLLTLEFLTTVSFKHCNRFRDFIRSFYGNPNSLCFAKWSL